MNREIVYFAWSFDAMASSHELPFCLSICHILSFNYVWLQFGLVHLLYLRHLDTLIAINFVSTLVPLKLWILLA